MSSSQVRHRGAHVVLAVAVTVVALAVLWRHGAAGQTGGAAVAQAIAADGSRAAADDLPARCAAAAKELRPRLGDDCRAIVAAPFVLAGNLSDDDLSRWHRRTIEPAAKAIANCY